MVCHVQSATNDRPSRTIHHRPPTADLTIELAIGLYLDSLGSRDVRDTTLIGQGNLLRRFFAPALGEPLHSLSTELLRQFIETLATLRNGKTGAPLTVGTRVICLTTARRFTRWCTAHGRLSADPMAPLKKKTLSQLHEEINQLRADVFSLEQERRAPVSVPSSPPLAVPRNVADLTVAAVLTLYLADLTAQGKRKATICTQQRQLRRFCGPVLAAPVRALSPERLQELARSLAAVRSKKTGAPLASETLRFCRDAARKFTRWCTAQGRLSADPMMGSGDSFAWLTDEARELRADLQARRQEGDQAKQPLQTGEGAR